METWSGGAETDCDGMGSTGVSLGRPFTSDFGRRSVPLCFLTWANRERFATEQSRTDRLHCWQFSIRRAVAQKS